MSVDHQIERGVTFREQRSKCVKPHNLPIDRLMKVIAKPIRRDDEKDRELLAVTLLDSPVRGLDIVRLELCLGSLDIGH